MESLSINKLVDSAPLGKLQIICFLLGFLTLVMDGFDTYTVGYLGPVLIKEWNLSPSYLGLIFSASMFSGLLGSVAGAPLADLYGRKVVLIVSVLVFGIATILSGVVDTGAEFLICRAVVGLGLGATLPNVVVIVSEFAPTRYRSTFSVLSVTAMSVGLLLAGLTAALMLPSLGWRQMLIACGMAPIIWAIVLVVWLPESIKYLVVRGGEPHAIATLVRRIDPNVKLSNFAKFHLDEDLSRQAPIKEVFSRNRVMGTIFLGIANSLVYSVDFLIAFWLPTLMNKLGNSIEASAFVLITFKIGAIIGPLIASVLMDRLKPLPIIIGSLLVGSAFIVLFGLNSANYNVAIWLGVAAGLFESAAFNGVIGFSANCYPTAMRASGLGVILGAARTVGSIGPMAGGFLLAAGFAPDEISFVAAGALAVDAGLLLYLMRKTAVWFPGSVVGESGKVKKP
jgi:AAHS family 4-hydroxybenzoate transporter-like MFS transporter